VAVAAFVAAIAATASTPSRADVAQPFVSAPRSAGGAESAQVAHTGAPPDAPGVVVPLSDERKHTLAAHVTRRVVVRERPLRSARALGRLRRRTYFGSQEVVLVLAHTIDAGRQRWVLIRYAGSGRRRGWVPMRALRDFTLVRTLIVINRDRARLSVLRRGRKVLQVPIGVGASRSPTPPGRYYMRERLEPRSKDGIYGVLAFGTSAYSRYRTDWPGGGQVGVHGTNSPQLIPGHISNGCVRLRNRAVRKLDRLAPVGTPIRIK